MTNRTAADRGPTVELRGVDFAYRSGPAWARREAPVLQAINLHINRGETLGLVGESGSGKTTIGRLTLGLRVPTRGRAMFQGAPMPSRAERRGRFAAVLQHPQWSLSPRLTVFSSVAEPLLIIDRALSRADLSARVAEMLDQVGLPDSFAERYPRELSGGQRQRVSIARALITRPAYVLFDEAVSALDVSVQAQMLNLIRGIQREYGFAALFISHDLAAVRYVADRIVVLRNGVIVDEGDAKALYKPASHEYTRTLQRASEL